MLSSERIPIPTSESNFTESYSFCRGSLSSSLVCSEDLWFRTSSNSENRLPRFNNIAKNSNDGTKAKITLAKSWDNSNSNPPNQEKVQESGPRFPLEDNWYVDNDENDQEFIPLWSPRIELSKKSSITSQSSSGVFSETPKDLSAQNSGLITSNVSSNGSEQASRDEISETTETLAPNIPPETLIANTVNMDYDKSSIRTLDDKYSRVEDLFKFLELKLGNILNESNFVLTNIETAYKMFGEVVQNRQHKKANTEIGIQTKLPQQPETPTHFEKTSALTLRNLKTQNYSQLPPLQKRCRASLCVPSEVEAKSESLDSNSQTPRRPRSNLYSRHATSITLIDAPSNNYYRTTSKSDYSLSKCAENFLYNPDSFSVNNGEEISGSSQMNIEMKNLVVKNKSFDQIRLKFKRSMSDLFNLRSQDEKLNLKSKSKQM